MTTDVKDTTKFRLFAVSGNRCAFPGCPAPIVDERTGAIVYQIAHIKAESKGGARYDATQTDDERRSFENLMLMCPNHHALIDKLLERYPVEDLMTMKRDHEERYRNWQPSPELHAAFDAGIHTENIAYGGSVITTYGQTGGINAHNVTISTPPRDLSARDLTSISQVLAQNPDDTWNLSAAMGDGDASRLLHQLYPLFRKIENLSLQRTYYPVPSGIVIATARQTKGVQALLAALHNAGLKASISIDPEEKTPHLIVGSNS